MSLNTDCCGVVCVIFTYLLILFVDAVVCTLEVLAPPSLSYINISVFNTLVLMALWSHIKSTVTDPGTISKGYRQLDQDLLPLRLTYLLDKALSRTEGSSGPDAALVQPPDLAPATTITLPMQSAPKCDEDDKTLRALVRSCRRCGCLKPPRTHHCAVCDRYSARNRRR